MSILFRVAQAAVKAADKHLNDVRREAQDVSYHRVYKRVCAAETRHHVDVLTSLNAYPGLDTERARILDALTHYHFALNGNKW